MASCPGKSEHDAEDIKTRRLVSVSQEFYLKSSGGLLPVAVRCAVSFLALSRGDGYAVRD